MRTLFTILLSLLISNSYAQKHIQGYGYKYYGPEYKQSIFSFGYTHQLPIGNLAERFGDNSSIGLSILIEQENNLFYGVQGGYIFGNNVKDSTIFDHLTTSNGAIIGADGHYANINLMERGFDSYFFIGYAIHTHNSKTKYFPYLHTLYHLSLTGFYLSLGVGYLQHQIFIDTKNQNVPQLDEEYKKGYDRLTSGISTKWEASYKYYSPNGKFQMYTGVNMTLAYTKNRRPYLFDQMEYSPTELSWDKLLGINIGVIIPVHRRNEEKFHYY